MPDPIEMLMEDHRRVEGLFDSYRQNPTRAVMERICTEVAVHTAVEERVVYPALASSVDGGDQMRRHAESEHDEVKNAMLELERVGFDSPEAAAVMATIIDGVTEHVQEEESEILPTMRAQLAADALERIGTEAAATKAEEMTEAEKAGPLVELTKDELYELAQARGIEHRSEMNKQELISALRSA